MSPLVAADVLSAGGRFQSRLRAPAPAPRRDWRRPSRSIMLPRCISTVRRLIPSRAPIWRLVSPASRPVSTSASRAVSMLRPGRAPRGGGATSPCRSSSTPERLLEAGEQSAFGERLLDEIDGAELHRPDRALHLAMAGHHDHRPVDLAALQLLHHVEAVGLRHAQIEQDAAGLEIAERFEEIGAGAERIGADLGRAQHVAQRTANVAIVVHDIDVRRGSRGNDGSQNRSNPSDCLGSDARPMALIRIKRKSGR